VNTRSAIVGTIIVKDLREFARDRFFLFMSIFGLVAYVGLFWVLPSEVDETINLGVVGPELFDFSQLGDSSEGLAIIEFDTVEDLTSAVETGDGVVVGLVFPSDLSDPTIEVYVSPDVPASLEGAVEGLATEVAYAAVGIPPPVSGFATEEIILGEDRAGDQVSLQDRFRPLLAFMVLVIESLALAGLVALEIQQKTVKAITVTPARVSDFLTSKALFGTALAFFQTTILLLAIGGLGTEPLILLTAILLGSILVTGFGLLAGSVGKDFVSIMFWSMLFLIPLLIPAIAMLFPGTTATWIKVLPSYPLAQVLVDVTSYGSGWSEAAPLLGVLALWGFGILGAGWIVLNRRVQTL
jgi:ABC-2 type transport system permease protein